ncbi:MAG: TonB C-terminal domain-containing protein [Nitrospirae bacterium]|nr:TonB C-terminal domain-containing protein [Nitrospirota bacterium]
MLSSDLKTAGLISFILHIGLLSLFPLVLRQRSFDISPSYTVSLISPDEIQMPEKKAIHMIDETSKETSVKAEEKTKISNTTGSDRESEYIDDRIAILRGIKKARQKTKEKAEISIGKQTSSQKGFFGQDEFPLRLKSAIEAVWVFPGEGKGLEAVISIRVMKNGIIEIVKTEKSSGNQIFDNSVLKAIKKVSPFEPPPYEMEINVRTKP